MKKLLLIILSMILCMSVTSCQNYDEPISVTEIYHDCEYTITLDKSKYDLDDTVVATVSFVNKSEDIITLYSPNSSHFLASTYFYENDNIKLFKGVVFSDMVQMYDLGPGEGLVFVKEFDLTSTKETIKIDPDTPAETEEPIKMNSEWKIKAFAEIYKEEDSYNEKISVEIIVPH